MLTPAVSSGGRPAHDGVLIGHMIIANRASTYVRAWPNATLLDGSNRAELDDVKDGLSEVAFIGGSNAQWIGLPDNSPRLPTGGPEPVFVNYFTRDTAYAALADRLRSTLDRFGLEHHIEAVESVGSWEGNCAMKAKFVRRMWEQTDRPVVWLDADATVEADPALLRACGADFAAHKWQGWEICSGTLFFGRADSARRLLDRWVLRCAADPLLWDQMHLDAAWADISATEPLITEWLPRSYLSIVPYDPAAAQDSDPVIKQWQASRTEKAAVSGGEARAKPSLPASLQVARGYSRFTRSPEGLFWGVEGVNHIKPEVGVEHPEGFDVPSFIAGLAEGFTVEVGCGVGRLSGAFSPDRYVGVDINPYALPIARLANPDHEFRLITEELDYPIADTLVLYTVLLHISDEALSSTLEKVARSTSKLIISEIMDVRWRRDGNPPVFNRNPEDYVAAAGNVGFQLTDTLSRAYARYAATNWADGRNTDLTTLVFELSTQTETSN